MQKKGRSTKKYLKKFYLSLITIKLASLAWLIQEYLFFCKKVIRTNTVVLFIQIQSNSWPLDQPFHSYIFCL